MRRRTEYLLAGCVAAAALVVYLFTLCPAVYVGDSGEICASALNLGIAHPPGYPLFSIIGKFFSYAFPGETIAARINAASAALAALALPFLFLAAARLRFGENGARFPVMLATACSMFLFAFSRTNWAQTAFAKGGIYSLNTLLLAMALFLARSVELERSPARINRLLACFAFIYGISLANHHTMAMLAPVFAAYLWFSLKGKAVSIGFSRVALMFAAGLAVFIYLPARTGSVFNWGHLQSFSDIISHVTRANYTGG